MNQLLTGASGFLGKAIYLELKKFGNVYTLSRTNAAIQADLVTQIPQLPAASLVVHCAGKAHSLPKTAVEKQVFFDVNLKGTENLLKGLAQAPSLPKSLVFISTVAVYGCDCGTNIDEEHPLNAQDPYGRSKIMAEELVLEWCSTHGVICTILRLPLLAGENPPGNLGAMINAIRKGFYFNIAGGRARKSMVLAKDVAKLIPLVAVIGGTYNLTDGHHPTFAELSQCIATQLGKGKPRNIPNWAAKVMAGIGDLLGNKAPINTVKLSKITSDLTFNDSKIRNVLKWQPIAVLNGLKV